MSTSTQENVRIAMRFFVAVGHGDRLNLLTLCAGEIAWIIPGKSWPLAATQRWQAAPTAFLLTAEEMEMSSWARPANLAQ